MKRKIFYISVLSAIALILFRAEYVMSYAKDAMNMCYEIIIPSLFPFFVCSGLLIYSGFCEIISKAAQGVMRPLFNVAPAGAAAFVLGIISGFPSGAVCAAELYRCGNLSKSEAERLLSFCNNSGPLFIIGSVGAAVYKSTALGVILYIIHIVSSIFVGIIFKNYGKNHHNSPPTHIRTNETQISEAVSLSLTAAAKNIITVCFSIIFFSALSRSILDLFPLSPLFYALVSGICEFSTGILKISGLNYDICSKLVLTSFIVGFSGLSVHLQVMAVTSGSGLSLKPYILGKCLHSITAAFMTAAALYCIAQFKNGLTITKPRLGASFASSAAIIGAAVILILLIAYIVKRKKRVSSAL